MRIKEREINNKKNDPTKLMKIVLFWTIFLFIVFLSKKVISYPKDNIDFLIKNLLSFICAVIVTGVMLHFLKEMTLKICIPIIWFLTILLIGV